MIHDWRSVRSWFAGDEAMCAVTSLVSELELEDRLFPSTSLDVHLNIVPNRNFWRSACDKVSISSEGNNLVIWYLSKGQTEEHRIRSDDRARMVEILSRLSDCQPNE